MDSYIIIGHGSETFGQEKPVPPGCILVLTEECGMLGTLPWQLYSILSNPANKHLFDDPVTYKHDVERLIGKPIRVLTEGQPYPKTEYILLSYSEADDYMTLEPSGVYKLPTPEFKYHPEKRGRFQHVVSKGNLEKAYEGAVFPLGLNIKRKSIYELRDLSGVRITQEELFQAKPGVYYNLLCRTVKDEKTAITALMHTFDKRLDVDEITDSYDFFTSVKHWLSRIDKRSLSVEKTAILDEIRSIVDKVIGSREARHNSVEETLYAVLNSSAKPSFKEIKALLVANPELVNKKERRVKRTPLMAAAETGYDYIIDLLLQMGANPNAQDIDGETPLFYAARGSQVRTMKLLLERGADPRTGAAGGPSLLHYMADDDTMTELVDIVVKKGVNPNLVDEEGNTALHIAVDNKALGMIAELLRVGVNPNLPNLHGFNPLMMAIDEVDYESFKPLVGATDLKVRSAKGTALGLAIKKHHTKMCIDLIKAGAESDWAAVIKAAEAGGMPKLAEYVRLNKLKTGAGRRTRKGSKGSKAIKAIKLRLLGLD